MAKWIAEGSFTLSTYDYWWFQQGEAKKQKKRLNANMF